MWSRALLILCAAGLCGCSSTDTPTNGTGSTLRTGRVYLIRGIFTPVCLGIDKLTRQLKASGLKASVHSYVQAGDIAKRIENKQAAGEQKEPLGIVGYSTGGNTAIALAKRLARSNIPVDLLVTIDLLPMTSARVPPNVRQCLNYHEALIPGIPLLAGGKIAAEQPEATKLENINFRRSPLRRGFVHHFNMDEQPGITLTVQNLLLELCPPEGAPPATSLASRNTLPSSLANGRRASTKNTDKRAAARPAETVL